MAALLAVDLGVRTGLALYRDDGRAQWARSQNFGSLTRLRRAAPAILDSLQNEPAPAGTDALAWVVLEGGGATADVWSKEAARRGLRVLVVSAETWRGQLLYAREQRSGEEAKRHAQEMARRVLVWSGAPLPKQLGHDAAEAVLVGLWAAIRLGWLAEVPAEVRRS